VIWETRTLRDDNDESPGGDLDVFAAPDEEAAHRFSGAPTLRSWRVPASHRRTSTPPPPPHARNFSPRSRRRACDGPTPPPPPSIGRTPPPPPPMLRPRLRRCPASRRPPRRRFRRRRSAARWRPAVPGSMRTPPPAPPGGAYVEGAPSAAGAGSSARAQLGQQPIRVGDAAAARASPRFPRGSSLSFDDEVPRPAALRPRQGHRRRRARPRGVRGRAGISSSHTTARAAVMVAARRRHAPSTASSRSSSTAPSGASHCRAPSMAKPGRHTVRVVADGFVDQEQPAKIVAGKSQLVSFSMEKTQRFRQPQGSKAGRTA